ncbi:MAG: ATP-binding protein [Thermodesulfobacteriota bacterium]|nr:ATP-binding protein [Thermodesulfobacteriota bacterium]
MISILEKETLLTKIIDTTTDAMGVKKASIFLLNEEKGGYYVQCSRGLNKAVDEELKFLKSDPFITWLRAKGEIVVTEELERYNNSQGIRETIEILRSMESEICIPLTTSRELIGFCNLGKKKSGEMFSHEDIDLLETLGNNAAIAIENAKLYEDLKKSESQVRRADRLASLGILTAGLAHEIRNPLVAIKTFTQLLPERLDDIEFREHFLKVTAGEVDRLSSLVNELLTFARPSEPNLQMENINDVAEKMILLVKTEAKKKNLKINTRYSNDVSDTMVDKEQIKQVLLNLFLNAIQATPENGTITFETRQVRKNSSTDYVQMEIRDTGTGIPKDDIEHIFTPFFTTKNEGSGLGLSICHRIIEEHSGYIEVESTEGEGTTFYINFPMNPAKDVLSSSIRTAANSGDGRP